MLRFLLILIALVLIAVGVSRDAQKRGMNPTLWGLITLLLPILGLLVYIIVMNSKKIKFNK